MQRPITASILARAAPDARLEHIRFKDASYCRCGRGMRLVALAALLACLASSAWAWGQEGHSIIGEIAQRRLSPQASAEVARVLGQGHSLASVGSWADDVRDGRPETYNWHFVDIPIDRDKYDASIDCKPSAKGDCIVAELERLKREIQCAPTEQGRRNALRFAVHFVADIHQPLHTVDEARGGNDIAVDVRMVGAKTCRGSPCPMRPHRSNFHTLWDTGLIQATTWSWGAYVDRLEAGVLAKAAPGDSGGTIAEWAEETHHAAQTVWRALPESRVADDAYYQKVSPILDVQLSLAGIRLAKFLNEAYALAACQ